MKYQEEKCERIQPRQNGIRFIEGPTYTVRDSETKEIIARGQIKAFKMSSPYLKKMELISFDRKAFFNTYSERFIMTIEGEGELEIPFTKWSDYKWCPWSMYDGKDLLDIYRDFGIDELDPPMVEIVKELNQWRGVSTVVSCCGHGRYPAWVLVQFASVFSMNHILYTTYDPKYPEIFDKFEPRLTICTDNNTVMPVVNMEISANGCNVPLDYSGEQVVLLVIATKSMGQEAYDDMNNYAKVLSEKRKKFYAGKVNIDDVSSRNI